MQFLATDIVIQEEVLFISYTHITVEEFRELSNQISKLGRFACIR